MATSDQYVSVLVGPTCPTCEEDDLHHGAPLGVPVEDHCRDCGTEYRWYEVPDDGPPPSCPACGATVDHPGIAYCEECAPADCAFCGVPTLRPLLSRNLACQICEQGEAA